MSGSGSAAQFRQLPMFMTAHEVQTKATPGDFVPRHFGVDRDVRDMWSTKLRESQTSHSGEPSLADSIRKRGVHEPLHLLHDRSGAPTLLDGHHRTAVAASISPNYLLPVEHTEKFGSIWEWL